MAVVVRMPGVSADARSAALVDWSVATGEPVKRGDVIATVETEKAVIDLESDTDGVLQRTFASAGEEVAVGGPIALLLQEGEDAAVEAAILAELGLGDAPAEAVSQETVSQDTTAEDTTALQPVNGSAPADAAPAKRIFATPLVRRLAEAAGVPLAQIPGSGPNGRIRRRDLEATLARQKPASSNGHAAAPAPAAGPAAAPAPVAPAAPVAVPAPAPAPAPAAPAASAASISDGATQVPVSRFRRAVATALTRSKQEVPHFYLTATCRADALLALREQVNAGGGPKVTVNDLVVKAAAGAMRLVPEMNVTWGGDHVVQHRDVDIAVAMATERGLVVPVVRNAAGRSLGDVSAAIKDLASRAAANTLPQHELEGGVLAVSNLGMFGIEEFTAIINPPQVGILAVGAILPQVVAGADGTVEVARCLKVTLSADHRPVDGALAARWLQAFQQLVENPLQILV